MVAQHELKCLVIAILKSPSGGAMRKRFAALTLIKYGVNSVEGREALSFVTPDSYRAAEQELAECSAEGVGVLIPNDPHFPELLRQIPDCPAALFLRGRLPESDKKVLCISVVGTRRATDKGLEFARELSKDLASLGVIITSGLALGIDTAAHCGALRAKSVMPSSSVGIAVLGSGVKSVYPSRNDALASELIRHGGAVVSEYGISARPRKHYFPERNRIISGLSHGTVVVEAKGRSGSLITARLALEQGRDVFAVPGEPWKAQAEGTNSLLKQGAGLIESSGDVLESFPWFVPCRDQKTELLFEGEGGSDEDRIFALLRSKDPCSCDALARELGMSISQILQLVTALELKGKVYRHPGDFVSLSSFVDM